MNWLLKIKVCDENKAGKIQSIFCWDEIHLNFCLCWVWINFFGLFENNESLLFSRVLKNSIQLFSCIVESHFTFLKYFSIFYLKKTKECQTNESVLTTSCWITSKHFISKSGITAFWFTKPKWISLKSSKTVGLEPFQAITLWIQASNNIKQIRFLEK